MSLPHRVARVTLSGTMFGGAEEWSTGFYLGHEDRDADAITQQGATDISVAWETFFASAGANISSTYKYEMCKVAMIEQDGHTIPDSAVYHSPSTPISGGSPSNPFPPQIALVATLSNSAPRGLATKGRMFLPGVNAQLGTDGHLTTISTGPIADAVKTFFDSVYNDADLPGNPVLASLGRGPLKQGGTIRNITQIRIGNVYDTQRRRRNGLVEAYVNRSVAGA